MLFIFLEDNPELNDILNPECHMLRKIVAENPDTFGEVNKDYRMFVKVDPHGDPYRKAFGIHTYPTILIVDDFSEEIIQSWIGVLPPIKTLFTWARSNASRTEKREL